MKIFKLCAKYLSQHKWVLILYIILNLKIAVISIISPYIIGNFLDEIIKYNSMSVVIKFSIIFILVNFLQIAMGYATGIIYTRTQTLMVYKFNKDVNKHIQNISLTFSNKSDSASLTQKINNDINELITFCISIMKNIIVHLILLIIPFIILTRINFFMTKFLFIFLLTYIIIYYLCKKKIRIVTFAYKEAQNKFFSSLYGQLAYIKVIKINSIQHEINLRLKYRFDQLSESRLKYQKINFLVSGLDSFVSVIAQAILFIVGGLQIIQGNFTIGMFTIFSSYFNLMIGALRYFFNLGTLYHEKSISYERINEILKIPLENNGEKVIEIINKISFEDINFSYGDKEILKNYNLTLERGNIYGIVGSNGVGKSTLIHLMLGFYIDEKEGDIKYNNTSINKINMVDVRKNKVGFSEQQVQLINDTIGYNLTFDYSLKYKQVERFLSLLNMTEYIKSLEGGIDFYINEKNSNLSGGEKQKIGILKVLLKDPQIMVFDEPTSELDFKTSEKFMNYLERIKEEKIIIIITHDKFVANKCDKIISLDNI